MTDAALNQCLSLEGFFREIEPLEGRFELHDGVVFALPVGTWARALISANALRLLDGLARPKGCWALGPDFFVVKPSPTKPSAMSPDAWVLCGSRPDNQARGSEHPTVIVEVLSQSTMTFDRGDKMVAYQAIPSLRHVVLVYQNRIAAEVWSRGDGSDQPWRFELLSGSQAMIALDALGGALLLGDLYRDVELAA